MAASKVTAVTDVLMARIISGEYSKVLPPQDVLSRNLEVSRTVIREAISKLEAWNVLSVRPKTGTTIKPSDQWTMVNVPVVKYRFLAQGLGLNRATVDMLVEEIRTTLLIEHERSCN
jgi:DNA-binding FadR family transcriptional regulator